MKKYLFFLFTVLVSFSLTAQKVKIGDMPTHNAKPVSAWIPIVTGGVNKKVRADSVAAMSKTDTLLIKKIAHDSVAVQAAAIATKATDTNVVHKTGNETIAGDKTLSGFTHTEAVSTNWLIINSGAPVSLNSDNGLDGQVMRSQGNGNNPVWQDPSVVKGYKEYAIILTQTGTGTPVASVTMKNEIGAIVWSRNGVGDYSATLAGAFTTGKTLVTPMYFYSKISQRMFYAYPQSADVINVLVRDDSGAFADLNISQATDFTIKVYN